MSPPSTSTLATTTVTATAAGRRQPPVPPSKPPQVPMLSQTAWRNEGCGLPPLQTGAVAAFTETGDSSAGEVTGTTSGGDGGAVKQPQRAAVACYRHKRPIFAIVRR